MKESTVARCSYVCCNIPKSIKRVIHEIFYFSFNYSWVANKLPPPLVKFWIFFQFRNVYMFIWTAPPPCLFIIQMFFYSPTMLCYTMPHHRCGSGKYTTVLCIGIGGADARVPAPFHTWGVEDFWSVLWCAESLQDWDEFFILVQVRLRDVKKIP